MAGSMSWTDVPSTYSVADSPETMKVRALRIAEPRS